jgi:replication factor C large subunit
MGGKMIPLCEKYRASCFRDLKGQDNAVESIKLFLKNFPRKKALLMHGPAGTGKTSLAHILAKEMNFEIFELNASDLRNREKLEEIMGPATQQQSLFGKKGKIVLVDEVDGLSVDKGGLPELLALIEKTAHPIVITANNIWQQKFNLLRKKVELVGLKEISYQVMLSILKDISAKEKKEIREDIIKAIAAKSRGDVRAALNDLQTVLNIEINIEDIHEREKEEDIFHILRKIFKNQSDPKIIGVYDNTEMTIDDIFLWIEENIPYEYKGEELARAYDALSKADVFRGRIYRQQHWRFLVYEYFLLSAGISHASYKTKPISGFTIYQRPKRILKIWLQNQKYARKKSIAAKYAQAVHIGRKRAMREFFLLPLILNKEARKKLKLSEDEETFLDEYQTKYKK